VTNRSNQRKPAWGGWIATGIAVLSAVALGFLSMRDVRSQLRGEMSSSKRALVTAAANVEHLVQADQARLDSVLWALRAELRSAGVWAAEPEAREADAPTLDARRTLALLRRALSENEEITGFDVVLAGHRGLEVLRIEGGAGGGTRRLLSSAEQAELAQTLWYSDDVVAAVEASGRRLFSGSERTTIGLHAPGEVVQGALLASIDRQRIGARVSSLLPIDLYATWWSTEGQPLDGTTSGMAPEASRFLGDTPSTAPSKAGDRLVLGRRIFLPDNPSEEGLLFVVLEMAAPASIAAAWITSVWPLAFALMLLVSVAVCLAAATWLPATPVVPEPAALSEQSQPASPNELALDAQSVVTREWLADVRGCLEREAAIRGLKLELRCARTVRSAFSTDPAWLGGLIVAMGREALDATAQDGIALEVSDSAAGLQFDFDAHGARLLPVAGMRDVARALGARFRTGKSGRLSLLYPIATRS
jgi:hypothetical protein